MAGGTFDRETLFDLGGGIIPIAIAAFFFFLFWAFDPFGKDLVATFFSLLLLAVPIVSLVVVLYVSGRIISEAEHTGESKTAAAITRFIAGEAPTGAAGDDGE